jgi:hypothetical protein
MAHVDIETRVEFDLGDCDLEDNEIEEFIRIHFDELDVGDVISIIVDNFDAVFIVDSLLEEATNSSLSKIVLNILDSNPNIVETVLQRYSHKHRGMDILAEYLNTLNPNWKTENPPFNSLNTLAELLYKLVKPIQKNTIKPAEDRSLEYE